MTAFGFNVVKDKRIVEALLFVFNEIDRESGRLPLENTPRSCASRPRPEELRNYPLVLPRCGNTRQARALLRHAHGQHEKGWLTDQEFAQIEKRCTEILGLLPSLSQREKADK